MGGIPNEGIAGIPPIEPMGGGCAPKAPPIPGIGGAGKAGSSSWAYIFCNYRYVLETYGSNIE